MPRPTTSSAVRWVIGRPDFSGRSQAIARILVTCSRGELALCAGAPVVGERGFGGPTQVGLGFAALEVNQAAPSLGPAAAPAADLASSQADLFGDVLVAKAVESQ